ncbi:MAG: hypothetical protein DLM58_22895 [Pseudonocardiales bacterium]|nr:MAG: hypothetical protein DLM58_22895 [Pseudonocardiales bacterium]
MIYPMSSVALVDSRRQELLGEATHARLVRAARRRSTGKHPLKLRALAPAFPSTRSVGIGWRLAHAMGRGAKATRSVA